MGNLECRNHPEAVAVLLQAALHQDPGVRQEATLHPDHLIGDAGRHGDARLEHLWKWLDLLCGAWGWRG